MNFEQLITSLKNKNYLPIYFLSGEETYYIDKVTEYILDNILTESEKDFNLTILYGRDTDIRNVLTSARRFPMMASHQIIIVKEAQNLKSVDDLAIYAEKPLNSTILVFNYKYETLDKRKKVYKALDKIGGLFEFKKLYEDQVPTWISSYLKNEKLTIDPESSRLLTEYLGNDLSKIANELDKLKITMPQGQSKITSEMIEKNIGISKEYNTFELQKALTKKDILKANRIINYFGDNQKENHISLIISSLFYFYTKILTYHALPDKSDNKIIASSLGVNPYFLNDYKEAAKKYPLKKTVEIISILRDFDAKSKGIGDVSSSAKELLRELLFRILH